jgi:DNA-binding transcriptional MerR regulator
MFNIDKLSYSIGQVSALTDVAQSTLRYWETVISRLTPHKTDGGSRRYSKEDIELVLNLKSLLYEKGFTIKGANLFLEEQGKTKLQVIYDRQTENKKELKSAVSINSTDILTELKNIKKILDR